ncbi:MAG: HPP family protein [Hyphomicrobiaceae bacterium]|nr:HPP family protein [Hyphomicrobiaceae bacterium]
MMQKHISQPAPASDPAAPASPTAPWAAAIAALGGGLGIAIMLGLAELLHYEWGFVPFATSIVLVLGAPEAPQAQPRNIVGGHLLSALCGLAFCTLLGPGMWAAALGVAAAIALMQATRTFHPPAGINPVVMAIAHAGPAFVLVPVAAGALLLVAYAYAFHRLTQRAPWPRQWL